MMYKNILSSLVFFVALSFSFFAYAQAPDIPTSADVGRIKPGQQLPSIDQAKDGTVTIPSTVLTLEIPEGAKTVQFELKDVRIEGSTAFTVGQLRDIYAPNLGKTITLDVAYITTENKICRY